MKANDFIQKTAEAALRKALKEPFEFLVTEENSPFKKTSAFNVTLKATFNGNEVCTSGDQSEDLLEAIESSIEKSRNLLWIIEKAWENGGKTLINLLEWQIVNLENLRRGEEGVTIHMLNQKETAARAAIHDSNTAMEALARAIIRAEEEINERT